MRFPSFIGSVFLVICLVGCKTTKTTTHTLSVPSGSSTVESETSHQIMIIELAVSASGNDEPDSIDLKNMMIVEGFLKSEMPDAPTVPQGKYRCSLLAENGNLIKSIVVDNPLVQTLEMPPRDENDDFVEAKLNYKKASMVLRVRYNSKMSKLQVEKGGAGNVYIFDLKNQ